MPLSGRVDRGALKPNQIAYLPQDHGVDRDFPMTLGELVALGLWGRRGLFGAVTHQDDHRIEAAMDAVGLSGFENRALRSVSGGQLQRALFARVLVQDARLILLDEPFTALDARTTDDLIALVKRWPGEGRSVVMVLHDLDMVRDLCADTLVLAREKVVWGPTDQALGAEHLLTARRLSEAWSDGAGICHRDHGA
jgi:zinc/manganese transport system ATP-binding protein